MNEVFSGEYFLKIAFEQDQRLNEWELELNMMRFFLGS